MNKKHFRVLYGAGACFVALFIYQCCRIGGLNWEMFQDAIRFAIRFSAGTSPFWVLIVAVILCWFGRKNKKRMATIMTDEYSEYTATQTNNRAIFRCNFSRDLDSFNLLFHKLRSTWQRIGEQRGIAGESHAGLAYFANVLIRHSLMGFQLISSYQSFLAWMTFRPGLEALLIIGKLVDDPHNADVWKNKCADWKLYNNTFSGGALDSKSLPWSKELRRVLSRLNDDFMHPNPTFTYRDSRYMSVGADLLLEIKFFDVDDNLLEAHLLSYLNLLDLIAKASEDLIDNLCGPLPACSTYKSLAKQKSERALRVASKDILAKQVMNDLGIWSIS
jgi:hypothetical protein